MNTIFDPRLLAAIRTLFPALLATEALGNREFANNVRTLDHPWLLAEEQAP